MRSTLSLLGLLSACCAGAQDVSFNEGLVALQQERHGDAILAFTRTVASEPDHSRAWYYRGLCRDAIGDHMGAMHDLDRAVALDPNDGNVLLRRADVYLNAGRAREARADLEALLRLHPQGPIAVHALFSLGRADVSLGEYQRADMTYDRLVAMVPMDPKALCDRGIVRGHLGRHQEALSDLDRAIALEPSLERAYSARAVELIALERRNDACPDLLKAHQLGDRSVEEMILVYCE
jgi:tetratricopeptide (TPR) repeat protein